VVHSIPFYIVFRIEPIMAGTSNGNSNSGKAASNGQGSSASASASKAALGSVSVNSVREFLCSQIKILLSGRVCGRKSLSRLAESPDSPTLACEIQMVNVASIVQAKSLPDK
jgi:hypothetical protein